MNEHTQRDTRQFAIVVEITVKPEDFATGKELPRAEKAQKIYGSFKPETFLITEIVSATYQGYEGSGMPDVTVHDEVEDARDVLMVHAFSGDYNCFPSDPTADGAVSAALFNRGTHRWPMLNSGINFNVAYAVEPSILTRCPPPPGYCPDDLKSIAVKIRTNLSGPTSQ